MAAARLTTWASRKEQDLVAQGSCFRAYSFLFVPCTFLVFFALLISGREIIWNIDGLGQYYPFFIYEGEWLRGIAGSVLGGQGLQVPLWEWCSGYGVDIPTTFDVFLDPLNLVSAITPPSVSEWVFQLLVVLRLYLAGLAFVFYCHTRGENRLGTVLGGLLYALCGAGLTGVRWASGLHALVLFPVVLAGAERILAGRRPWVFVASLATLAVVSYYFTYMACILLVAYLALRVVMVERPHLTAGIFMRWVGIFAGLTVLCLVLASFALVPAGMALFGMDRLVDQTVAVPLAYSPSYYLELLTGFLSTSEVGSDTYQGFGGLAFLACVLLFSKQHEQRELKLAFAVLTAFFLFPQMGSFFNAMNYASNRWAWAYDLCVALILARMAPKLLRLDVRTRRMLAVGMATYAVVFVVSACRTEANVAGYAALLGAFVVVLFAQNNVAGRRLLAYALVITLAVNGFYFLASDENGKGTQQVPLGMAYAKLTSASTDSVALAARETDNGWWRYDAGQVSTQAHAPMNRIPNNSLVLGLRGIDFYNSVYNDRVDAFHTELAIAGDDINFRYTNLQGRADLMALLGVKYYTYRNDGTDALPYGFSLEREAARQDVMGIDYKLVQSDVALPLGVAFSHALAHKDYAALSPAQKQQALLQAVVLDNQNATTPRTGTTPVDVTSLEFEDVSVPFQIAEASGVTVENGRWVVADAGASVTLSFEGTAQADTYLYVSGLKYERMRPSDLVSAEEKARMMWYHRANLLLKDLSVADIATYEVAVRSDTSPAAGYIPNSLASSHMYGGKDTWLVSLGYTEEPTRRITISFDQPGLYTFDDMQVVTQTHAKLAGWVQQLSQTTLQDVELGCNSLTGSIALEQPQTLLLTVAYSAGWTAYVDGKPTDLLCADSAFMALDLEAGHHSIELRYATPGLAVGFALSGAGVVALVLLALRIRRAGPKT